MDKKRAHELSAAEIASIHAYLYGELSDMERQAFESRMDADHEWRDKVEEVKLLALGVQEANLANDLGKWRTSLTATASVEKSTVSRLSKPLYRRWWVAASVILLAIAGIWAVWPDANTPERLYRAFYEPDIGLPVAMSASDESRYDFYDGMISYKEGNYAEALAKWTDSNAGIVQTDTVAYYRAMAHMGLKDIPAATSLLSGLATEDQSAYHTDAIWYLALCYLQQGDIASTTDYLRQIPHDNRAQALLGRLE